MAKSPKKMAARKPAKKMIALEVCPDLQEQAKAFAAERGQTFRAVVEDALRRHLAYPPKVHPPQPLPDAT